MTESKAGKQENDRDMFYFFARRKDNRKQIAPSGA